MGQGISEIPRARLGVYFTVQVDAKRDKVVWVRVGMSVAETERLLAAHQPHTEISLYRGYL